MRYEVRGRFRNGTVWMPFKKIVDAHSENFAKEKVYSLVGSNHKVKRNLIKVESVELVE